jgi:hypothetical protein
MIAGLGRFHLKRLCNSKKHYFRDKLGTITKVLRIRI